MIKELSVTTACTNSILDFWQTFSLEILYRVWCATEEIHCYFSAKHLEVELGKKLNTRSMTYFLLFSARISIEQAGKWDLLSTLKVPLFKMTKVHHHQAESCMTCCQQSTVWHSVDSKAWAVCSWQNIIFGQESRKESSKSRAAAVLMKSITYQPFNMDTTSISGYLWHFPIVLFWPCTHGTEWHTGENIKHHLNSSWMNKLPTVVI